MSDDYQPWLPQEALDPATVSGVLERAVEQWSARWFAGRPMRLLGPLAPEAAHRRAPVKGVEWHMLDKGLALSVGGEEAAALARAMLDLAADEKIATPSDQALAARLVNGCIGDLKERLCALLDLPAKALWARQDSPPAPCGSGSWFCTIGPDERAPAICLVIEVGAFVTLVKREAGAAPAPARLRPLKDALALQPVRLSAFLGGCTVSISDLSGLASGDVIILDAEIGDDLTLTVDGRARAGRCTLGQEDGQLQLTITQPMMGEQRA